MKLSNLLFIVILPLVTFTTCHDEETIPEECLEPVACTFVLISFSVSVKNQHDKPVSLDEYYSENLLTKQKFDFQDAEYDSVRRKSGSYPLLSDQQYDNVMYKGSPIQFIGKIKGKTVVHPVLMIGKDCCHIQLMSGDTDIIITE